jgi:putative acetyltransferase
MIIRNFKPSDAHALAALFHASVHRAGITHYSTDQVRAWSPSEPDAARYVQQAVGRIFLVAVDDGGSPIGYGDLCPDGYIDHLYCSPEHVGTGVGSAIYAA